MENSVLISIDTAQRLARKVPRGMGVATVRRVYKRYALQGYSIVVKGKVLNERAMTLLST
jgi:transaldolase